MCEKHQYYNMLEKIHILINKTTVWANFTHVWMRAKPRSYLSGIEKISISYSTRIWVETCFDESETNS